MENTAFMAAVPAFERAPRSILDEVAKDLAADLQPHRPSTKTPLAPYPPPTQQEYGLDVAKEAKRVREHFYDLLVKATWGGDQALWWANEIDLWLQELIKSYLLRGQANVSADTVRLHDEAKAKLAEAEQQRACRLDEVLEKF